MSEYRFKIRDFASTETVGLKFQVEAVVHHQPFFS